MKKLKNKKLKSEKFLNNAWGKRREGAFFNVMYLIFDLMLLIKNTKNLKIKKIKKTKKVGKLNNETSFLI